MPSTSPKPGDTGPASNRAAPAPGTLPVRMNGVPVGLTLVADEYLTNLNQELGMLRLDGRPATGDIGTARSVAVVDQVLSAFASVRAEVRRLAEDAYDRGEATFSFELEMPLSAAGAATALAEALHDLQSRSAQGRILLPPPDPDAAEFFYGFLSEAARQLHGQAPADDMARGAPPVTAVLEEREAENLVAAPIVASCGSAPRFTARRDFPRDLHSATCARRFVVDTLRAWGFADTAERAELPAAELAANALLHSSEEIEVVLRVGDSSVLVEVHDSSPDSPGVRRRGDEADSGRGLMLVDAMADRWGFDDESSMAKRVWFELALPAPAPS